MKLLLLAGTFEARQIAGALRGLDGLDVVASLAGATSAPARLGVEVRRGGFGGAAGFDAYLTQERIAAVLDATHPFAARISRRSAALCRARGLPYLQVLRPPWRPGPGDAWTRMSAPEEAAALVPRGARVFLATGPADLGRFAALEGRRLYCRRIEVSAAPFPLPDGEFVVGRPPFDRAQEAALFARLGIDWLIARDSGGASGRAKLDAARDLGIRVALIDRPAGGPDAPRVETAEEAVQWVRGML